MGTVQHTPETLIEVATGEAKYEQLFHALVWRIPQLGQRQEKAYKSYKLKYEYFNLANFNCIQ